MPQDRPPVPAGHIKVQYRSRVGLENFSSEESGQFAIDVPGRAAAEAPFIYTVNAETGQLSRVISLPPNMQVLRPGMQHPDAHLINPYPQFHTLAFTNQDGLTEMIPLTPALNGAIYRASQSGQDRASGAVGNRLFDYRGLTQDLDPRRSDSLRREGRGQYDVIDIDTNTEFDLPVPPRREGTPDQSRVRPGGRGHD